MNHRMRRLLGLDRGMPTYRALVLGCGPAGLFAAWGLEQAGWSVTIYSKKRKSHLYGAQYLHAPIPGLTPDEDPITVKYHLNGSVDGYRSKVYGAVPVKVSPEELQTEHPGWDIRSTYDAAWERYEGEIQDFDITPEFLGIVRWNRDVAESPVGHTALDVRRFDAVISTIPLRSLCYQPDVHTFHGTPIWAYGDAPDRGQRSPIRPTDNVVECDGTRDVGWYRASNIYGHVTVEWPHNRKPPLPGIAEVIKPIYTDCICYRDGVFPVPFIPLGRYGQWSKGVLTHHAYTQAVQL